MRASLLLPLLLISSSAWSSPAVGELQAAWTAVEAQVRASGRIPVNLGPDELSEVAAGETSRSLVQGGQMLASQGALWTERSCAYFWVALQDPEHLPSGKQDSVVTRLPGSSPARRMSYQLIDAPWPLSDRQQAFAITANTPLWEATGGKVWERSVSMLAPEVVDNPDPEAVWIPHTGGGFVLVEVPTGGCLVVLQLEVDPGGVVPADLATRFGLGMMKRNLEQIASYTDIISEHYDAAHPEVLRPDGSVIPPGSL